MNYMELLYLLPFYILIMVFEVDLHHLLRCLYVQYQTSHVCMKEIYFGIQLNELSIERKKGSIAPCGKHLQKSTILLSGYIHARQDCQYVFHFRHTLYASWCIYTDIYTGFPFQGITLINGVNVAGFYSYDLNVCNRLITCVTMLNPVPFL